MTEHEPDDGCLDEIVRINEETGQYEYVAQPKDYRGLSLPQPPEGVTQRCLCEEPHPPGMHKIDLLRDPTVSKEQIREHLRLHMEGMKDKWDRNGR